MMAQVRKAIRRTDNAVASSLATTDNKVATSLAIIDAKTCISLLVTMRSRPCRSILRIARPSLPFREDAKAVLKARHDGVQARLEAYRIMLTAQEAGTSPNTDAAAKAAR